MFCNDDSRAGWQEGLHRLRDSNDPIQTLEEWRRDTVERQLLDSQRRQNDAPKVCGDVIMTSSGYYAARLVGLESGPSIRRCKLTFRWETYGVFPCFLDPVSMGNRQSLLV
jgi:hypothetical protein